MLNRSHFCVLVFMIVVAILNVSVANASGVGLPIYDMHEHFTVGGNMKLYLKIAQKLGIKKTVFVGTGKSPDNAGYQKNTAALLALQKKYPNRIIAYCTIDEADETADDYFSHCLEAGGKGLKILGGHTSFYDAPLDSDVMKKVFRIANDREVPVLVHVSIVNLPKAKQEFLNLMNQFPKTRVQFAHYCSTIMKGVHLEECAEFLDKYENMYVDLSLGGSLTSFFKYTYESPENLKKIRDFILKYQDRFLFGTDMVLSPKPSSTQSPRWVEGRIMCDLNLMQKQWYKCPVLNFVSKTQVRKYPILPGLNLPEEVLQKIFVENPKRLLGE